MKFTAKKTVAIIGGINFPHPLGMDIIQYNIYNQQPKTWERKFQDIHQQIIDKELHGIIIYLATPFFLQASKPDYINIWAKLIKITELTKSMIVVYEENIHENFDYYDYDEKRYLGVDEINERIAIVDEILEIQSHHYSADRELEALFSRVPWFPKEGRFGYHSILENLRLAKERIEYYNGRKDVVSSFIDNMVASSTPIKTFKEKQNIAHLIEDFLYDIAKDIFFNIYVSKEQILHEEFSDFVKIFEKYMQNIEGVNFIVDSESTINGTTYYFRSKSLTNVEDFSSAIRKFDKFVETYVDNPESAIDLVTKKYGNNTEVLDVIQGIMKKYQRLMLDIKHQQQRIRMMMEQEFENLELEGGVNIRSLDLLNSKGVISDSTYFIEDDFALSKSAYSESELSIMQIAKKHGSQSDIALVKSSIDKLKDAEMSPTEKISSAEKVKGFLLKAGKKAAQHAEDIGVKVLTSYLDNLIKGGV